MRNEAAWRAAFALRLCAAEAAAYSFAYCSLMCTYTGLPTAVQPRNTATVPFTPPCILRPPAWLSGFKSLPINALSAASLSGGGDTLQSRSAATACARSTRRP